MFSVTNVDDDDDDDKGFIMLIISEKSFILPECFAT